jgi:hypothetical protein
MIEGLTLIGISSGTLISLRTQLSAVNPRTSDDSERSRGSQRQEGMRTKRMRRKRKLTIGTFIQTLITTCDCDSTVGGQVPSLSS